MLRFPAAAFVADGRAVVIGMEVEGVRKVAVGLVRAWVESDGLAEGGDGVIDPSLVEPYVAELVVCGRVVRVQTQQLLDPGKGFIDTAGLEKRVRRLQLGHDSSPNAKYESRKHDEAESQIKYGSRKHERTKTRKRQNANDQKELLHLPGKAARASIAA